MGSAILFALLALSGREARAQCATTPVDATSLSVVKGPADDSLRLGSILGWCNANGSMIRSALTLRPHLLDEPRVRAGILDPEVATVWNSDLPNSRNDGALWAGRGMNYVVRAGGTAAWRNFDLVVAPMLMRSENRMFDVIPASGNAGNFKFIPTYDPNVSSFASPWHTGVYGADIPLRFGNQAFRRIDPGESWARVRVRSIAAGISNATMWWGPGVENALVMSNNAGGIPHLFLGSAAPTRTRIGDVEWLVIDGVLTESAFFDVASSNDRRSLSAAVVTLRLAADTGLTVGVARSVYQPLSGLLNLPFHGGDFLGHWNSRDDKADQLTGVFGRWAFPASGLAAYGEWMRLLPPHSLKELMVAPGNGQGYTIGLEWASSFGRTTTGLQVEATNLEQTPSESGLEWRDFYTSSSVRQGYTQRGQIIGAAIGPGASSQSLRFRALRDAVNFGLSLSRVRWEDGAYYRSPGGFNSRSHDVSLEAGAQLRVDSRYAQLELGFARTLRKNYLFQSPNPYLFESAFDHRNTLLTTRISPHF
jgi:hypothetical protein